MPDFMYYGPAETREEALEHLAAAKGFIAVDTETVSLKDRRCIGIGVATSATEAWYFPCFDGSEPYDAPTPDLNPLRQMISRLDLLKVVFNIGFDYDRLLDKLGIAPEPYSDLSVMCHVQGLYNSLEENVGWLLCRSHPIIADILPKRKTMLDVKWTDTGWKCMQDCLATWQLFDMMDGLKWGDPGILFWRDTLGRQHDIPTQVKDSYKLDMAVLPVLWKMAKRGLQLDHEALDKHYRKLAAEQQRYKAICEQQFGFNPGSPQQVGFVLASRGNFLEFTKTRRQLKVDDEALISSGDPLGLVVLEYRKRQKLLGTYIVPWLSESRAYTHFRLDLATGRTASFERNLQNIPPSLREIFVPDNGDIWTWWDFSQIEMRVFAALSNSGPMLQAYRNGDDIHYLTQSTLWPGSDPKNESQRLTAKTYNFAMIYYATAETLAKHTGLPVNVCAEFRRVWLDKYACERWMEYAGTEGIDRGWVEALDGRRMRLPPMTLGYDHVFKCGINYRVQGTAAVALKRSLLLQDTLGYDMPLQVHDETLIDDGAVEIPTIFEHVLPGIPTPFDVKRGPRWS